MQPRLITSRSINEELIIQFWSLRLGCSKEELTAAFEAFGISEPDIKTILQSKKCSLRSIRPLTTTL